MYIYSEFILQIQNDPNQSQILKEQYISVFLTNIDKKIMSRILTNQIQKFSFKIVHRYQLIFILRKQSKFTILKSSNVIHHMNGLLK